MPVDLEKLQKKLEEMPRIKTSIRKIQGKDGRYWYVIETRITQFLSPEYMAKVQQGNNNGTQKQPRLFQ